MTAPTVIPPGGGEIIGDAPDRRVEILCERDALHATWSRFGPGRDGAERHIHRDHTDLFYLLGGELTIKLADGEMTAPAGSLAVAPPLAVHGFRNAADVDVRYLNLHAPGCGFVDYMRGLRDGRRVDFDQAEPPAEGTPPASDAMVTAGEVELDEVRVSRLALEAGEATAAGGDGGCTGLYVLAGELSLGDEAAPPLGPGAWATLDGPMRLEATAPLRLVVITARG